MQGRWEMEHQIVQRQDAAYYASLFHIDQLHDAITYRSKVIFGVPVDEYGLTLCSCAGEGWQAQNRFPSC